MEKRKPFSKEYRIIHKKSGEVKWVNGQGEVKFDNKGNILSMIGTIQDITERKLMEEMLRNQALRNETLLSSSRDGIHVLDLKGNVLLANDVFCQMLGYTHEEALKLNVSQWDNYLADAQFRDEVLSRQLKNPEVFEAKHKHHDGRIFDVEISVRGVEIGGKKMLFAASRDISERKKTEELRQKYLSAVIDARENECHRIAKELHDGVIQLLGATLHRLRSPAGSALNHTTDELLTRAINETRRITYSLRPTILDDLGLVAGIQSYCSEFEERSRKKIELNLSEFIKPVDQKVELAIYRIVVEALNNIEKHSNALNVQIKLGIESSGINLRISDNGKGFDLEKSMISNRGLGLLHMKERAFGVGGSALIESTIGQGTIISVKVPLQLPMTSEVNL